MSHAPQPDPGKLTLAELSDRVHSGQVRTVVAAFPDHYGRLMGKRFDAEFFLDHVAEHGTHACNYLLTADMEMEPVPGFQLANWEKGYGDFHLTPDLATLRIASWLDRTAMVLCDVLDESSKTLIRQAPRAILRCQVDEASRQGFGVIAGSEVEYYIFRESYRDAAKKRHVDLEPAGWYLEDYHTLQGMRVEDLNAAVRRHLVQSGVPVECTKGEWGLGQQELNIRCSDVLQMADRHSIYKQCLRETADQMGLCVTFMAKYSEKGAGSSCHLHLSLWRDQTNVFVGNRQLGPLACSDEFRWFLGGWMAHAADVMVFYAPTVNSYKRFQPASWAPTRLAWSYDNRTAGFRVVGSEGSLRIECRVPGADANPYLAYAAALASGLDGIAQRIEPPRPFEGNVYNATGVPELPRTLTAANERFGTSEFARKAFGSEVVDHYANFFRSEQAAFERAVTDWERWRYFERI
jgi:glutamine synthetase